MNAPDAKIERGGIADTLDSFRSVGAEWKERISRPFQHPRYGPPLKVIVGYVVIIEIALQLIFGRIDIPFLHVGFLEIGRKAESVPRGLIVKGAMIGSLYALVAMGLILVYKANRIINFAQAQLGSVPGVIALLLIAKRGWPYLAVLPIVLIGGALLGGAVEVTIIRRFSNATRLILTVVTIGVSLLLLVLEFVAKSLVGGKLIDSIGLDVPSPFERFSFDIGSVHLDGDYISTVVVVGIVVIALGAFFKFTDIGIAVRASAENAERASLLGIPTKRVSTIVWMIAAMLSALGVFLYGPLFGLPLSGFVGPHVLLMGLTVAVMAKMDSLPGAFVSGMLLGVITQVAQFSTNRAAIVDAVVLVTILVALLTQSKALSRAMDSGVATWQAARDYRPIPAELAGLPVVRNGRMAFFAAAGLLAVATPWIVGDANTQNATLAVLFAMIGVSLVILTGWTGQISLGQYAITGIGAAAAGGLAANHGWDFFACVFTAGMVGALVAVLIGLPALRIQGLLLAVTTLAFAFATQSFFLSREYARLSIFGKTFELLPESGSAVDRPILYGRFNLATDSKVGFLTIPADAKLYWLCLVFLGLSLALARAFRRNRSGRIVIGVRDNGRVMQAYGVNLAATRMSAFAISGFIAGLAGGLLAYRNTVFSGTGFSPELSILLFAMVVIGGIASLPGAILGAIFVEGVPLLPGLRNIENIELISTGVGLLLLLLVMPGGLAEGMYRIRDNLLRRVAVRHNIHVPSLVADSLQLEEDEADDPLAHMEELGTIGVRLVECPTCEARIPHDEVEYHKHFAELQIERALEEVR